MLKTIHLNCYFENFISNNKWHIVKLQLKTINRVMHKQQNVDFYVDWATKKFPKWLAAIIALKGGRDEHLSDLLLWNSGILDSVECEVKYIIFRVSQLPKIRNCLKIVLFTLHYNVLKKCHFYLLNTDNSKQWLTLQIRCCYQPNYDFRISQGSVPTVTRWGGQNYSHLCQVSSQCCMPKIH